LSEVGEDTVVRSAGGHCCQKWGRTQLSEVGEDTVIRSGGGHSSQKFYVIVYFLD